MAGFVGRLFGPGLPGSGAEASGRWQDGQLHLSAAGRAWQAGPLAIDASGFNASHLRLAWAGDDGDYAFCVDQDAARAAFAAEAPAAVAAQLERAVRAQRELERRFRFGWFGVAAFVLMPFIALAIFFIRADTIAGWVVDLVPYEHEQKLGDLVLAQTRAQMRLRKAGPAVDAIRVIGERLVPQSRLRYRWFVAERPEVNAFAAPGGVIVVFSGLIEAAASPDEVAGVLAHEVAHAELRHSLRAMVKNLGWRALLSFALGDYSGGIVDNAVAGLTELKFSRDAEREADMDGLKRLVAAGVDPNGMLNFFAKLAPTDGKAPPALLSTHPAGAERLAELRAAVATQGAGRGQALPIDWAVVRASLAANK